MARGFSIVDGVVPTALDDTNLRDDVWAFALDQRAFGPRKLLVAFADADGTFRGLAFTDRTDPPELGFEACLTYLGQGAAAAVAYCDQPVDPDAASAYLELFERARELAATRDIHLLDWIACDDEQFLAHRIPMFARDPAEREPGDLDWWDVPPRPPAPPLVPFARRVRATRGRARPPHRRGRRGPAG